MSQNVRVRSVVGAELAAQVGALARLRVAVFREWPYLYDGDLAYEEAYLRTYAQAPHSVFVLAQDPTGQVVGMATGLPLTQADPATRAPFETAGIDLATVFYFGESVLDPAHRGQGLGHAFFDAREAQARHLRDQESQPLTHTAFCAVDRAADDPRRPPGARDLSPFWQARGYTPNPHLKATFTWREQGAPQQTQHTMIFWQRPLD
jgi:GNAT superfamily N-acetyltransferase